MGSCPRPRMLSWGFSQSTLSGGKVQELRLVLHFTVLSPEDFYTSRKKWGGTDKVMLNEYLFLVISSWEN